MSIQAASKVRMNLDALTYAQDLWESLDTPISLSCSIISRYKEYDQLIRKSIDPLDYQDEISFFKDYQSVKLLSKYPYLETGIDTKKVAYEKFISAEDQCRRTNVRWRLRENGYHFDNRVESVISRAQRKISLILSDVPTYDRLDFAFGPGAAYGVRGETSVFNKVTCALECTYALADYLPEFLGEFPGWITQASEEVRLIPGNQLAFVPKDAKTDRPICIEPLLNGLYQKGFGSWIRRRLLSFGIDLRDQSTNQKLAQRAFSEALSTIDFASASDTIAYRVVLDLLPFPWFEALDCARSPNFEFEGKWTSFQKFTSMGNAYTFELETLIFYAIACACCEELGIEYRTGENLSVYGDDVIIPNSAYDLFSEVTIACGFTINHEKSFREGPFFESCGCDYFLGTPVRPYLLKKRINTLLPSFYAANTIQRIRRRLLQIAHKQGEAEGPSMVTDMRLKDTYHRIVSKIPSHLRVLGPEGYGDGHLICSLDSAMTSKHVSRHAFFDAWRFLSYAEVSIRVKLPSYPSAYALYFTMQRVNFSFTEIPSPPSNGEGYTVRGRTRIQRQKQFCPSIWPDPLLYND